MNIKFLKWFRSKIQSEGWYKCFSAIKKNNKGRRNVYFKMHLENGRWITKKSGFTICEFYKLYLIEISTSIYTP